jgi:hypothetical protein
MDEQKALSVIANESDIKFDYADMSTAIKMSIIEVEQTQTKDGIKVTLHKVEFTAEYIAAFLTVEKTSDDRRSITFYDSKSIAIQADYEFKVTSKGPSYKSFRRSIRYGRKESGAVKFERLYYNELAIKFEFPFKLSEFLGEPWFLFEFEVQMGK